MYLFFTFFDKKYFNVGKKLCLYLTFQTKIWQMEKVTPLIWMVFKSKQRKNGIVRFCPELNLALSDNPDWKYSVTDNY